MARSHPGLQDNPGRSRLYAPDKGRPKHDVTPFSRCWLTPVIVADAEAGEAADVGVGEEEGVLGAFMEGVACVTQVQVLCVWAVRQSLLFGARRGADSGKLQGQWGLAVQVEAHSCQAIICAHR